MQYKADEEHAGRTGHSTQSRFDDGVKAAAVAWAGVHGAQAAADRYRTSQQSVRSWAAAAGVAVASTKQGAVPKRTGPVGGSKRSAASTVSTGVPTARARLCPQRGRRYGTDLKKEAVAWAAAHGRMAAAKKFGVSTTQLARWQARIPVRTNQTAAPKKKPTTVVAQVAAPSKARHGRRYGIAEKKAAVETAQEHGVTETVRRLGISRASVNEWKRRADTAAPEDTEKALKPRSSAPKHNAKRLSEERYHLIADTWKQNQALGPRQVRNQLRRSHGLRVGTSTVRRVMVEHGYVPPKISVERKVAKRYEAVRPNQQWHLDFIQFFVHKAKCYILLIEDDHSRFIVGWALCEGEQAQPVIEAVDEAIARHGRPEQMVIDGGSGFFSWKGQSQLERVVGDYGNDFIKASKRGSNSKLESLNANVRKELLKKQEFEDLADARIQIARWVRFYNMERTHQGLGGLLVPADRYFGRTQEVLAQIERGEPVVVPGPMSPDERALDLFRVISRNGRPELWLLGECIWPSQDRGARKS